MAENPQLQMTPMIDVVFQLMIFFIVTLKREDILSHLDVSRPQADPTTPQVERVDDLVRITVHREGYLVGDRPVSLDRLDRRLSKIASVDGNASVIIQCTMDSPHSFLIRLLDVCAKAGLKNLSVFSL